MTDKDQIEKNRTENGIASVSKEQKAESHIGMSDDDDLALSQTLDAIEKAQNPISEPKPAIQLPGPKKPRLLLNLKINRLGTLKNLNKTSTVPSANATITSVASKTDEKTIKEAPAQTKYKQPILCTPSDDERSQTESPKPKLSTKTLNLLHSFRANQSTSENQILRERNAIVTATKSDQSQSENDSAYDTMAFDSSLPSTGSVLSASCRKTGKTPALFAESGVTQNNIDDDDLSFLDSIEF